MRWVGIVCVVRSVSLLMVHQIGLAPVKLFYENLRMLMDYLYEGENQLIHKKIGLFSQFQKFKYMLSYLHLS